MHTNLPPTRTEALAGGSSFYFTGMQCPHGHLSKRLAVNSTCHECNSLRGQRDRSSPKKKAEQRNRYLQTREIVIARSRQWQKENGDADKAIRRAYRSRNAGKLIAANRLRNTRHATAIPSWSETKEIDRLYLEVANLNDRHNLEGKDKLCVDHIIPIDSKTVCGLHCMANLQVLSKSLNSSKGKTYQTDW